MINDLLTYGGAQVLLKTTNLSRRQAELHSRLFMLLLTLLDFKAYQYVLFGDQHDATVVKKFQQLGKKWLVYLQ